MFFVSIVEWAKVPCEAVQTVIVADVRSVSSWCFAGVVGRSRDGDLDTLV